MQSDLVEIVYINAIPGRPLPPGKCYKLNCALYGLKQAGRNWNSKCSSYFIDELGFIQLRNDLCVYILVVNEKLVAVIALYVDDIILGFDTEDRKQWFITNICSKFSTKVIGLPKNVIGLSLTWEPIADKSYFKSVKLVNIKSVKVLAKRFNKLNKKSVTLPYNVSMRLSKDQCPSETDQLRDEYKAMQTDYRAIVGTCIWLQSTTRPDIMSILLILTKLFI